VISIKEKIQNKPSVALQFMLDGLIGQSERSDFEVDMSFYGDSLNGVCYGCAATCAIQELTGINYNSEQISYRATRCKALSVSKDELGVFECAINGARNGSIKFLFEFCNLNSSDYKPILKLLMTTSNYKDQLPLVKELIEDLKLHGF
jgi:hypothetical protein